MEVLEISAEQAGSARRALIETTVSEVGWKGKCKSDRKHEQVTGLISHRLWCMSLRCSAIMLMLSLDGKNRF